MKRLVLRTMIIAMLLIASMLAAGMALAGNPNPNNTCRASGKANTVICHGTQTTDNGKHKKVTFKCEGDVVSCNKVLTDSLNMCNDATCASNIASENNVVIGDLVIDIA